MSKETEKLNDELFALVEGAQGHAFISDGEGGGMNTTEQYFERIRGRLLWSVKSCKLIRQFLRKHRQELGAEGESSRPPSSPEIRGDRTKESR